MKKDEFLNTRVSNKMKSDLKCKSKIENIPVGVIIRSVLSTYLYENK